MSLPPLPQSRMSSTTPVTTPGSSLHPPRLIRLYIVHRPPPPLRPPPPVYQPHPISSTFSLTPLPTLSERNETTPPALLTGTSTRTLTTSSTATRTSPLRIYPCQSSLHPFIVCLLLALLLLIPLLSISLKKPSASTTRTSLASLLLHSVQ